ncbi:hybrid sensor histidine kinase/response regulator [Rhodohalobacter sulfatireducens]|uniref:histidine kinase n=1 Tax=Rhodohalobacter sulfatireducens TaxID=2911366 RepID=A0ABS9KJJ2_9BACT|nr:response regulator [Rhodohalobacter sulfatireducens]MCG2590999.1 response regulator [Rhodohalobacter sulfatireducens]
MSLLFLVLSFFLQQSALPTGQEYIVQNYTIEDGLPVNSVNRMVQDNNGYLYFATTDGLAQYDGYEFVVYNSGNTPGLFSNRISQMTYIPEFDELWLLHADGALTRKVGPMFQSYSTGSEHLQSPVVQLSSQTNGELWILTENDIARYDRSQQQFNFLNQTATENNNQAMTWTDEQKIIVSSGSGLYEFDPQTENSVQLLEAGEYPVSSQSTTFVKKIGDYIWVTGTGGAFRYSMISCEVDVQFTLDGSPSHVWDVHQRGDQSVLLNSNEGFFTFDPATFIISNFGPSFDASTERANLVYEGYSGESILIGDEDVRINGEIVLSTGDIISGYLDKAGSLWISTLYDGVFQIRQSVISNITPEQVPGFENIYPVIESSDGSIWAGSFHNGIYRLYDDTNQNWNAENSRLSAQNARFLYEDIDGTLYASIAQNGLWRLDDGSWQRLDEFTEAAGPDVTVESMHRSGDRLFIGTTGEMIQFQNGEFKPFRTFEIESGNPFQVVRVIRENRNGTLFTGSFGYGLTILKNGIARNYRAENSGLQSNFIRDIFVQSPDTLWVATEDLGLSRIVLDSDAVPLQFTRVMEQDGLIHNSLHRMIQGPEDRLWISSNGGIMAVSLSDLNRYADGDSGTLPVLGFNEAEGMLNREANGGVQTAGLITRDQKQIIFPNQRGLTVIHLSRLDEMNSGQNLIPVIEEIAFADTTISAGQRSEIELPTSERNIRIKFTAPNPATPERTMFRYRLDDVNREWEVSNDIRQAVFTNVPPGWHTFHLQVYLPNVQDQVKTAAIDIFVPYFFYETSWFYGLAALLGVLLMVGGVRYRTRLLKKRERKLQARVNQQTKELKEAAEQKSRFFSGITHELKTPLSLISSPLDDLIEDGIELSGKKARERLHLMKRNSDRLQNLVDQILGVSKLDADKLKLTFEPVDIAEHTRQLLGQFQSSLDQKEITLNIHTDTIDEKIYIDSDAWERILINLMSNAIRFSPEKSTISVQLLNKDETVTLEIKDRGIGIHPDEAEKIFDYLYQADDAYAAEGTGIGLYLVKGLVARMNGEVGVLSKKGEGAEFFVTLKKGYAHLRDSDTIVHFPVPRRIEQNQAISESENRFEQNERSPDSKHLFLVEDNDDFRDYLQSVLSEKYKVTVAKEGEEALKLLQDLNVDLVISDVMMPKMNGLEFVNTLRKQEDYQKLPVIFLSAKDLDTDKEAGLSSGADVYLTKPIKSKLLLSQIDAVLRRENVLKRNQLHEEDLEENQLVKDVREMVYRQLANPSLSVDLLADALFVSRSKLYADWKEVCDTSLNAFIKKTRLDEGKKLIKEQDFSVQEAATAVGFPDPNYFSTSFKKEFGVSPSEV